MLKDLLIGISLLTLITIIVVSIVGLFSSLAPSLTGLWILLGAPLWMVMTIGVGIVLGESDED